MGAVFLEDIVGSRYGSIADRLAIEHLAQQGFEVLDGVRSNDILRIVDLDWLAAVPVQFVEQEHDAVQHRVSVPIGTTGVADCLSRE